MSQNDYVLVDIFLLSNRQHIKIKKSNEILVLKKQIILFDIYL